MAWGLGTPTLEWTILHTAIHFWLKPIIGFQLLKRYHQTPCCGVCLLNTIQRFFIGLKIHIMHLDLQDLAREVPPYLINLTFSYSATLACLLSVLQRSQALSYLRAFAMELFSNFACISFFSYLNEIYSERRAHLKYIHSLTFYISHLCFPS